MSSPVLLGSYYQLLSLGLFDEEKFFLLFNTHLTFNDSVSGLELCPICKKGHLYPVVTASTSPGRETGPIGDYECAICGHKQKAAKQTRNVAVKDKVSASIKKTKKTKTKTKAKAKRKRTN